MKYIQFNIINYRAIENATLIINNNKLLPIIGINESGKTSILYALLCFHKQKDKFAPEANLKDLKAESQGAHLNYENNYYLGKKPKPCIIKADVLLENKDEIEPIVKKLSLGAEIEKLLLDYMAKNKPITLCRELKRNTDQQIATKYFIENFPIQDTQNENFANELFELTPHIVYFNTFENKIDDPIDLPKIYFDGKDDSKLKEWRDLLQEIFISATLKTIKEEYTIQEFLKLENGGNLQCSIINAINQQLNEDIMKQWKNLSEKGQAPSDVNFNNLSLDIKYEYSQENPRFHINVIDKIDGATPKVFSINERSTGLRWFFNFIIKLTYNPDHKKSGAIFLLDEPGSNLHSTAQEGLLKKLQQISEDKDPIIFGTHSEDLLDPEIINLAQIKIAKREGDKIIIKNFNEAGTIKNEGAWTPLYRALHLKSGFAKYTEPKVIITEGITDYHFFKMIQANTNLIKNKEIKIIPGASADQLKDLISIAIASSKKYLILLDSDKAGKDAYIRYKKFFGDEQSINFYKFEIGEKNEGIKLEDFLSITDVEKLKTITNCSDQKNAIITLYHSKDEEKKNSFVNGFDTQTLNNLTKVLNRINELGVD